MMASKHDLDGLDAVAVEQLAHPPRAHQAGRALGIEVGGERLGHPGVAVDDRQRRALGTPASQSRIGGTISPSSKTLVALPGIEPGTAPPMSS